MTRTIIRTFLQWVVVAGVMVSSATDVAAIIASRPEDQAPALGAFDGLYLLRAKETYCSAVIVGPQTLLTAAYCLRDLPSQIVVKAGNEEALLNLDCAKHPRSSEDSSFDFALCRTDRPFPTSRIERISTDATLSVPRTQLVLAGYGCSDPTTRTFDGKLSLGVAVVTAGPRGGTAEVKVNGAAACSGDAGGGAFVQQPGSADADLLVGIISRGDLDRTTVLASTSSPAFLSWAKDWSGAAKVSICGISDDAETACAPRASPTKPISESPVRPATATLSPPTLAPDTVAKSHLLGGTGTETGLRQIRYRKGEVLANLVQISCYGTADEAYIKRVLQYLANNSGPTERDFVFDKAGVLTLPVCPAATRQPDTITVEVTKRGSKRLWDYFLRYSENKKLSRLWDFEYDSNEGGRLSLPGFGSIYFVDVFRELNHSQDPNALTPGPILLPLRPKLAAGLDQPAANVEVLEPILALQNAGDSCAKAQDNLTYPYDLIGLLDVLASNARKRRNRETSEARIVIIDSGLYTFRREDSIFSDILYVDRSNIAPSEREAFLKQIVPRLPGSDDAAHGTWVASVALGGPLFARVDGSGTGKPRLRIDPYRLQESRANQVIVPADKFGDIFRRLNPRGTVIVNLSLRTTNSLGPVLDRLGEKDAPLLFVVAAGNGNAAHVGQLLQVPKDGNSYPVFPAVYGGTESEGRFNLITVAALTRGEHYAWERAAFSDFSPVYVEIGAPGCAIPVEDFDREEESWRSTPKFEDGTSFAAPLVSFTAGLLSAENPDLAPLAIKARILAASDLNPNLVGQIVDGRSLNVVKALALHQDVMQVDGHIFRGTSRFINVTTSNVYESSKPLPITCNELVDGEMLTPKEILKIVPSFNEIIKSRLAADFPDRIYVARGAQQLKTMNCKLPEDVGVKFNQQGSGGSPLFQWNEIQDLIPKLN